MKEFLKIISLPIFMLAGAPIVLVLLVGFIISIIVIAFTTGTIQIKF